MSEFRRDVKRVRGVGHEPKSWLCWLGIHHSWEDVGLAQQGHGRLQRCRRKGCKAVRRVAITLAELQAALDEEVDEVQSRPKAEPEPEMVPWEWCAPRPPVQAAGEGQSDYCLLCKRPFRQPRCPNCGRNK